MGRSVAGEGKVHGFQEIGPLMACGDHTARMLPPQHRVGPRAFGDKSRRRRRKRSNRIIKYPLLNK